MKISELRTLTLREVGSKIRSRETSPTEIVKLLIEEIHRTDERLRAYITVCEESALEEARDAELKLKAGQDLGPLHGFPVSIKDLFETEGIRTTCGSKLMSDYVPKNDATVVKRLKSSGAIVLGKTNTHEFALGYVTPPTRNPWNLEHIPGGSSGGSGAAIAACSALSSTGSDTTGSIRVPASLCGVVGLKPTYGRVSRAGIFPESWSLDHAGPITRRVEDAALMLTVIAGYDEMDPTSSSRPVPNYVESLGHDIEGMKMGIPKNYFFERCDAEIRTAVDLAIDTLGQLGCRIVEFEFPYIPEIVAACTAIDNCESSAYHATMLAERPNEYNPDVRLLLEQGLFLPATYYIQGLRYRSMILPKIMRLFKQFDVMVTPTEPVVAPKVGESSMKIEGFDESLDSTLSRYVAPFSLLGLPALSIPCGFSSRGLPIGMQIIGYPFDEATVLQVGDNYERATGWHQRFPQIS